MWGRSATLVLFVAAAMLSAGADAMTVSSRGEHNLCSVRGGEKLPADAGSPESICAAIKRAVAARTPNARFTAVVKVLTPSQLATTLVVDGRPLPEQRFAVMDRNLNKGSIERFAQSIAAAVAEAVKA